ncbi:hypothetical protein EDB19DRAFT_1678655 [Suillus lakei]|nr:hypothetical protein EDB19DRAFT_1678655 [Suillus lakei]
MWCGNNFDSLSHKRKLKTLVTKADLVIYRVGLFATATEVIVISSCLLASPFPPNLRDLVNFLVKNNIVGMGTYRLISSFFVPIYRSRAVNSLLTVSTASCHFGQLQNVPLSHHPSLTARARRGYE